MAITPAALWGPVQLTTSAVAVYTCPANGKAVIKRAVFTNMDNVPVTITVYVVRNGGSPAASNVIIDAYSLSATEAYVSPELANLVLSGGDSVQALASITLQVNAVGSGFTA